MTTTITNKGSFRFSQTAVSGMTLGAVVFGGTVTGVHDKDLNTVADLDAVTSVTLGTERLALASVTSTEDDTNNWTEIDAANAVFAIQAGYTALGWAVYHQTAAADASRELLYIDDTNFGAGKSLDGGLTVTITGLIRLVPQSA